MKNERMRTWIACTFIVFAGAQFLGCNRGIVNGRVVNVDGDALPGVAVHTSETDYGRLTNGRGEYRVIQPRGPIHLRFSKTGYSPAELKFDVRKRGRTNLPDVEMWMLPERAGVYVFEGQRYHDTTWLTPKNFFMAEGGMAFATRRDPELVTTVRKPLVVCYNTPRYNARLTRMRRAKAKLSAGDTHTFPVWTAGGTIQVDLVPLDTPEALMLKLRMDHDLEPGTYAIHWGALEGYTTLETRVFMFTITDATTVGS